MIKHIKNEDEFAREIQEGEVLVDFFATWCGPCQMLGPILEEIAEKQKDIRILKVDVDACSSLARNYGVMSVPTLLFLKEGKLLERRVGFMDQEAILQVFASAENDE